ncbi:Pao retrotransposon peptidase family protein [Aphelenchoides avenae]|nr:Pao retrotransposon peptidase family protein [Aphelenchus avenae]
MAHTTEEAVEKYKGTKAAFSSASMNFNRTIPEVDQAKETKEKTLGHHWDSRRDVWEFALPDSCPHKLNKPIKAAQAPQHELALAPSESDHMVMLSRKAKSAKFLTKRVMLSVIHSLWDPLGLFAPVTLQARLLYQSLWDDNDLNWDDPVSEAVVQTWEELTSSWLNAKFEVPRFLFKRGSPRSAQLHVFADASDQTYGAVAYLRIVSDTGSTYCMLVFGKNRMVTKKPKMTIPRKELMAATVGCTVIRFLRSKMVAELMRLHKLDYISTHLWSDNQGVLFWNKDSGHFHGRFVQNRLEEIRKTADVKFLYVPTKDNPADVLSRGATVDELKGHNLWWTAAPWLVEEEKQWPQQPANFQPFSVDLLGLDGKPLKEIMSFHIRKKQDQPSESLLDMVRNKLDKKVRTYPRARRVTVHLLRFCALKLKKVGREFQQPYLKHFTQAGTDRVREDNMLYLFRYNAAELALVKSEQLHHPPTKDQRALFRIETFPDGLLRCHGRLDHSGLPQNTIYPMWLPEGAWLTRYVVHTLHVMHAHAAVETTLALLRRRFWLVKGRRNISTIIRKNCVGCRIAHGPAFRIPEYAKLPAERLRECRPFAHIGLDLFGPFQVRMGSAPAPEPEAEPMRPRRGPKSQRHRQAQPSNLQKVWGVIFTCMATRAVHLEVVHSQSAEHLLQAFDMFMSRRGMPKSVTSDNAPSIMLVNRTVDLMWKQALTDPATAAYCRDHGVAWHYITPESPWQGGFYERLIRSVKHSLSSAIGRNKLHFTHFVQVLTRVEHTINCRPITAQSQGDIDQLPLRPIDFLQPMAEYSYAFGPSGVDPDDEDYHNRLNPEERLHELFRKLQAQLDKFWDRWRTEYLLSLRETQRVLNQSGRIDRTPQVGKFVFVDDEELMPRSMWNIARVVELIPGRDGTVRHVRLRYPGGAESTRSVEMLHPLELRPSASESTEEATVRQDQQ